MIVLLLLPCSLPANERQTIKLGKDARRDLAITVYNNDLAVVREVRELTMPNGLLEIEYQDVARRIDPSSVMVKGDRPLQVMEQNYRYDLLNKQSLLERYIDREIKYSRYITNNNQTEKVVQRGILLSLNPEIVKFGDEIEISPEGTISLPDIPEGLTRIPALVWLLENSVQGRRSLETTYHTGGISWQADHTLILNQAQGTLDLSTWVTLSNNSGAAYEDAAIKLIAGEVNRVRSGMAMGAMRESATAMAPDSVRVQGFHEYQLYAMPGKTSIADRETKQLHLLSAGGIDYEKIYRLESGVQPGQWQGVDVQRFDVWIVISNDKDNNLGMPLPRGKVRVYERDTDGHPELAGEDSVGHTPEGEKVSITTGKAFDLIAERKQSTFRRVGENSIDVGYEINVRNQKHQKVKLTLRERLYGDWTILQQSHKGERVDSTTLDFTLEVAPGDERTVSYVVRMTR